MAINKKHIENIYDQKFSLFDFKRLRNYFEDEKLNEKTRQILKGQWEDFETDPEKQENLDHVFYKLHYSITKEEPSKKVRLSNRFTQIAAILIVGLLIVGNIYYTQRNPAMIKSREIKFISQTGFRNQFKLPDGTTGWLGHGSVLKYQISKNGQRIIDLDGLAFFNVSHNDKQPFIVTTPAKLTIRVLGTKFNVSSYSQTNSCEIVLEEGSVNLNLDNRDIDKMMPNERVVYHTGDKSFEKSIVNVNDFLAWKDGKLVLNDVSLEEACVKLSRFYNVRFELQARGLEDHKIRLVLEDEPLEDVLKLLTKLVPVEYQIPERKMTNNNSYSKKTIIFKNK